MVAVNLKSNIAEVVADLSDVAKNQVPFATHRALNDTAFHVRRVEQKAIVRYMDSPTPFTQRSPRVQRSPNKRVLVAWVYIDPTAAEYVERLVEGGVELPKGQALVSPIHTGRNVLNKYGNIHRKFTQRAKANKKRYFFGVPRGRKGERYAGVWERYGRGGKRMRQLVHFQRGGKVVEKQYPFYKIATVHAYTRFPRFFARRLDQALRTARL